MDTMLKVVYSYFATTLLLLSVSATVAFADTTYRLERVTALNEIQNNGVYVIAYEDGATAHVMTSNLTSGKQLVTVTDFNRYGLTGSEDYVWRFEKCSTNNYYLYCNQGYLMDQSSEKFAFSNSRPDSNPLFPDYHFSFSSVSNGFGITPHVQFANSVICYFDSNIALKDKDSNSPTSFSLYHLVAETGSYERTCTVGNFGTICLPYAVSDVTSAGADFYEIAALEKDGENPIALVLQQVNDLVAGTPYLFKATAASLHVEYEGAPVNFAVTTSGMVGNLGFDKLSVPTGCYILSSNQIHKIAAGATANIAQYRAYIDLDGVSPLGAAPLASPQSCMVLGFDGSFTPLELTDYYAITMAGEGRASAHASHLAYDAFGRVVDVQDVKAGTLVIRDGVKSLVR